MKTKLRKLGNSANDSLVLEPFVLENANLEHPLLGVFAEDLPMDITFQNTYRFCDNYVEFRMDKIATPVWNYSVLLVRFGETLYNNLCFEDENNEANKVLNAFFEYFLQEYPKKTLLTYKVYGFLKDDNGVWSLTDELKYQI
jgi:hypothetical protein